MGQEGPPGRSEPEPSRRADGRPEPLRGQLFFGMFPPYPGRPPATRPTGRSLVCERCGLSKPRREFRYAEHYELCRACAVEHLSREERADLKQTQRAFRRRLAQGYRPTQEELYEAELRKAALAGLSEWQYRPIDEEMGGAWLWWYPSYVLFAAVVGCVAVVLSLTTRPPAIIQMVATILLLIVGAVPAHWVSLRAFDPVGKRLWATSERRVEGMGGCLVIVWVGLLGLLLPVLIYVLVRIVIPPTLPS